MAVNWRICGNITVVKNVLKFDEISQSIMSCVNRHINCALVDSHMTKNWRKCESTLPLSRMSQRVRKLFHRHIN